MRGREKAADSHGLGDDLGGGRWLHFVLCNLGPCVVSPAQAAAPAPVSFLWAEEGPRGGAGAGRWQRVPRDNTRLVQRLLIGFLLAFHIP